MEIDNESLLNTRRHIQSKIAARIPFFYGWIILPVVLAIQVASSPGQTFGVSIFNPYIRAELGLSHSEISGAYMLGTLLAALSMGTVPAFNHWLIQTVGWRWAYAFLGIGVVCVILPLLAFVFRNRPEDVGQKPDGLCTDALDASGAPVVEKAHDLAFAIRTRAYWIMAVAVALPSMIITGIHFHAVQIYRDIGMTETDVVGMFSVFAAAVAISMLLGGLMADRFRPNLLLSGSFVGISLGIWLLTQVSSPSNSAFFAVSLGAGQGIFMAVRPTIWVRYYGRAHLGKIRGTLKTVEVAASSTGPLLMGAAHDLFGSYNDILIVFASLTVPMVIVTLFVTPPKETALVQAELLQKG